MCCSWEERHRIADLLEELTSARVLTVGDMDDFLELGGVIKVTCWKKAVDSHLFAALLLWGVVGVAGPYLNQRWEHSKCKSALDALFAGFYFPPHMKLVALQVEVLAVVVTDDAAWACRA